MADDGAAKACRTFAAAEPAAPVWAWGADQHARFWPRRMLFETAIHRIDLDLTLGREPDLPVQVAVEGIDEQLENLPFVARWNGEVGRLRGAGQTLGFTATDADASWRVRLEADGWWWDRPRNECAGCSGKRTRWKCHDGWTVVAGPNIKTTCDTKACF